MPYKESIYPKKALIGNTIFLITGIVILFIAAPFLINALGELMSIWLVFLSIVIISSMIRGVRNAIQK